jgi:hypothetical protein
MISTRASFYRVRIASAQRVAATESRPNGIRGPIHSVEGRIRRPTELRPSRWLDGGLIG